MIGHMYHEIRPNNTVLQSTRSCDRIRLIICHIYKCEIMCVGAKAGFVRGAIECIGDVVKKLVFVKRLVCFQGNQSVKERSCQHG